MTPGGEGGTALRASFVLPGNATHGHCPTKNRIAAFPIGLAAVHSAEDGPIGAGLALFVTTRTIGGLSTFSTPSRGTIRLRDEPGEPLLASIDPVLSPPIGESLVEVGFLEGKTPSRRSRA